MYEEEILITKEDLKMIGEQIEGLFGFKSLDVQIIIDEVLCLGLLEEEKFKMFIFSHFVNHELVYILLELCETFSIQSGYCIFADTTKNGLFLENCLNFSQHLI